MVATVQACASESCFNSVSSPSEDFIRYFPNVRILCDECDLKRIEKHVEALNYALAAVPADRVRMHVCWGNYEGPHHKDVPLATILKNPDVFRGRRVGVIITGGNVDLDKLPWMQG
jgi:hypothetical protein